MNTSCASKKDKDIAFQKRSQRSSALMNILGVWGLAALMCACSGSRNGKKPSSEGSPVTGAKAALGQDLPPLRLGVFAESAFQVEANFLAEISKALGRKVELTKRKEMNAWISTLKKGRVDLAVVDPYVWLVVKAARSRKGHPLHMLAQHAPKAQHRGACINRIDDRRVDFTDLTRTQIGFVSPYSDVGYFYPRARMRDLGLNPDTHFSKSLFFGSSKAALQAMVEGQVDLACLDDVQVAGKTITQPAGYAPIVAEQGKENPKIGAAQYRQLLISDAIPPQAFVALGSLDASQRKALRTFLLTARMGSQKAPVFVAANAGLYQKLEAEMRIAPKPPESVQR